MPLADHVAPYEFEPDLGPPLSEWERSDEAATRKFHDLFPDGVVPIRYVPTLGVDAETPLEWAEQVLSVFEAAHAFDLNRLDDLSSRWHTLFSQTGMRADIGGLKGGPSGTTAATNAKRLTDELASVTRELMGLGLSMRALGRYLNVSPRYIAESYVTPQRIGKATAALAADDLADDVTLTAQAIALETGYSPAAVKRLRTVRGIRVGPGPKKTLVRAA